jgi:hypothetical protein
MSAGQVSDYTGAAALLGSLPQADWLLADRRYDASWLREALETQEDKALHPWPEVPHEDPEIRQAALQKAKQDRDHVRASQGLAARRNALRQMPGNLPFCHLIGSNRDLLAVIKNES